MKTKLLLLIAVFGLLSCSGDDDSSSQNQSNLILGTWKYYGYKFDGEGSIPPEEDYADNSCGYWATDTFTESGVAISQGFDANCNEEGSASSENYSVDGGYLIYHTSDEGDIVLKIDRLTSSELILTDDKEHLIYKR